jgi:hypothetical protein
MTINVENFLTGEKQQNNKYTDRTYYHGISGRRLLKYRETGEIPEAIQAFGGFFSITDDYYIAKGHSLDGVVLLIKVNEFATFKNGNPFDDEYCPLGDITDIGESEFIVNDSSVLIIQGEV